MLFIVFFKGFPEFIEFCVRPCPDSNIIIVSPFYFNKRSDKRRSYQVSNKFNKPFDTDLFHATCALEYCIEHPDITETPFYHNALRTIQYFTPELTDIVTTAEKQARAIGSYHESNLFVGFHYRGLLKKEKTEYLKYEALQRTLAILGYKESDMSITDDTFVKSITHSFIIKFEKKSYVLPTKEFLRALSTLGIFSYIGYKTGISNPLSYIAIIGFIYSTLLIQNFFKNPFSLMERSMLWRTNYIKSALGKGTLK